MCSVHARRARARAPSGAIITMHVIAGYRVPRARSLTASAVLSGDDRRHRWITGYTGSREVTATAGGDNNNENGPVPCCAPHWTSPSGPGCETFGGFSTCRATRRTITCKPLSRVYAMGQGGATFVVVTLTHRTQSCVKRGSRICGRWA